MSYDYYVIFSSTSGWDSTGEEGLLILSSPPTTAEKKKNTDGRSRLILHTKLGKSEQLPSISRISSKLQ